MDLTDFDNNYLNKLLDDGSNEDVIFIRDFMITYLNRVKIILPKNFFVTLTQTL